MWRTLIVLSTCLALVLVASAAWAQSSTTTQSTGSTSTSTQGAYDKLSPGNQKIVQALCNAQQGGCPTTSTSTQQKTLTRDQIAAMKQHRGWGEIFKEMKANGQIPSDVKNLGQLVSGRYQAQSTTSSGTTITTGSGRSQVVGSSGKHGFGSESERGPFGGESSTSSAGGPSGHSGGVSQGGGRGR